jgi:NADH:ubiquinone oxidoreductase subunit 2 (subunit N)
VRVPFLLLLITGLGAIVVAMMRRRNYLAATTAGIISALIAAMVILMPMDEPISILGLSLRMSSRWQVLGRSFVLDSNNRAAIGYLYLAGGFILAGAWIAQPIRIFFASGLVILALGAASLMINPFLYAAIFLEMVAIVSLLILSSRRKGRSRGGIRLLTLSTFAMIVILLVGRMMDLGTIEIENLGLIDEIILLLGIGLAILLAVPPFHSWIPVSSEETHPFALTFVTVVLQGAGFFLLLQFMHNYEWLGQNDVVFRAIQIAGATMAWLCALWSAVQHRMARFGSFALLSDLGVMLVAVGSGTLEGYQLALGISGARVVILACWSFGMSYTWHTIGDRQEDTTGGEGSIPSLAKAAVIFSMMSFAGLPMTAGFPGRWGVLNLLTPSNIYPWMAIIASMGLLSLAAFRCARGLLMNASGNVIFTIHRREKIYLAGGILLGLLIGIFPQLLFPWVSRAISGLVSLSP